MLYKFSINLINNKYKLRKLKSGKPYCVEEDGDWYHTIVDEYSRYWALWYGAWAIKCYLFKKDGDQHFETEFIARKAMGKEKTRWLKMKGYH